MARHQDGLDPTRLQDLTSGLELGLGLGFGLGFGLGLGLGLGLGRGLGLGLGLELGLRPNEIGHRRTEPAAAPIHGTTSPDSVA